jgi:hypothetical protein
MFGRQLNFRPEDGSATAIPTRENLLEDIAV